ncbi:MAG TPA: alpha-amylase, partial [Candidatus Binatia bacterium]|nr:alpha-amylase [Candidatus Binatia bacterium]
WSALAERKAVLMTHALQQVPETPSGCAWVTYARCHDDIGWAVSDEDAAGVGLSGALHRTFLSDFYSAHFPGSFARGATFQFNARTGDRRISGSLASLAGLEVAQENQDSREIELAVRRILLLHNLIFALGGIPLIYMGDELGLLNDYSYLSDPDLAGDNRWIHRPRMDWNRAAQRQDDRTIVGQIFQGILALVAARKATPALHAQAGSYAVSTYNEHVFGLLRDSPRGRILVVANVSEDAQRVSGTRLQELGFGGALTDLITGLKLDGWPALTLEPYQVLWLSRLAANETGRLANYD